MSVRRLAEDQFQPAAFAFTDENAAWAEKTIQKYPGGRQQSAVIPLLMRAQEQEGWVTRAAIERIADMLDMAYIRVLEVATFYTQFQLAPVGTRAHVQVCGTTPCMLRGSEGLMDVCKSRIHAHSFHQNEAGTLSWEEVECLGACVNAPMVMIGKDTFEDLTPQRLEEIIDAFEAGNGASIKPGPQIERHFSAPEGGATTLLDDLPPPRGWVQEERDAAQGAGQGTSLHPSEAARHKSTDQETNEAVKTPVTDPEASKGNAKAAETQPLSATASTGSEAATPGSTGTGAAPEAAAEKPKRTRRKVSPDGEQA